MGQAGGVAVAQAWSPGGIGPLAEIVSNSVEIDEGRGIRRRRAAMWWFAFRVECRSGAIYIGMTVNRHGAANRRIRKLLQAGELQNPQRLKLVRNGEVQAGIERDAGFFFALTARSRTRVYLVVTKAFAIRAPPPVTPHPLCACGKPA